MLLTPAILLAHTVQSTPFILVCVCVCVWGGRWGQTTEEITARWFQESSAELKPLFMERNRLYSKCLSTKREIERKKFARMRGDARQAVREAKNTWFLKKAEEVQRGRHGRNIVWKCFRDIQRGKQGLVPVRSATIRNENGVTCSTTELQHQRWRRHFEKS